MRISHTDVLDFASWSGDRNPLHVDPQAAKNSAFGGTIVHGALSTIAALRDARAVTEPGSQLSALEIEFRGEIRPDRDYRVDLEGDLSGGPDSADSPDSRSSAAAAAVQQSPTHPLAVLVAEGSLTRMVVRAEFNSASESDATPSDAPADWVESAVSGGGVSSAADEPVDWSPQQFRAGQQLLGVHRFGVHTASADSPLTTTQEQVLALCSFIVGMKAPGLSSLFTRLRVRFNDPAFEDAAIGSAEARSGPGSELSYRLTFRQYDPYFRLLETELEVATTDGRPVATAEIQSYVRFPQREPDPASYVRRLEADAIGWAGKVALICGASRGLGAEMAAALGAARGHVYLACRNPNEATQRLVERIRQHGGTAEVVAGDVGDAQWCEATRQQILDAEGRLDVLVLNACAPPVARQLSNGRPAASASYVADNLALVQTPLIEFLPLISDSEGTVIGISSSFVKEAPSGFADYVAVKMAMEGAMQTAAHETPTAKFLIARPPRLQTSWNDTPTGAMGAIPPSAAALQIVNRAADRAQRQGLLTVDDFPDEQPTEEMPKREDDLKIVFCASFTPDPLVEPLKWWSSLIDTQIGVELAPYAQILQQSLDPTSVMSRSVDGSVLLLRVSDWLRERPADGFPDTAALEDWLRSNAREHIRAIRTHRGGAAGPTWLLLCPSTNEAAPAESVREIEASLLAELSGVPGLTVLDVRNYHDAYQIPPEGIFDSLREEIAHIPYTDTYYGFLASLIVRGLYRRIAAPKKVIAIDCDNTLWSGVVGEVGAEGIRFGSEHQRLHRRLTQLAESGVLLCLCSKNEEQDVWSVFEQRQDFGIRRDHVVAAGVNWLPKSQNLQALAQNLNLGLDSFLFLDDNPVECAEVRSGSPSVLTLQWPLESDDAVRMLDHLWELDVFATTAEDRKRTQMYREEFRRQQTRSQTSNFQDFIDSLQLVVEIAPLSDADLPRASQLTLRTNQFNFTTIRRSEAEIRSLRKDPDVSCQTVRVRDRFGDYGLVGLLIARAEQDAVEVDTFLLSCRVLGRGVEHRMASALGRLAQSQGLDHVRWRHLPTERNTPARMFLKQFAGDAVPADASAPCDFLADASELAELQFQAGAADGASDAADQSTAATRSSETATRSSETSVQTSPPRRSPRAREQQIERIVRECSSYAQLQALFAGSPAAPEKQVVHRADVARTVAETFAKALRRSAEEIERIDRLEAMGCDSLRIVEITVALSRHFPWLPKTLLFEHRRVSEIVSQIADLSAVDSTSDTAVNVTSNMPASEGTGVGELAIVGIGVHSAAGETAAALWELLQGGRSAVTRVPLSRASFVGTLKDDRSYYAGLVDDADRFDPEFFGISAREAEYMDPQLRLLLQTAWHALEDAGSSGDAFDLATGVFVGVMYGGYGRFANAIAGETGSLYRCWEGFSLANRLSQTLGCHGPSLSIDTACSSSATALHYACRSIQLGDCTTAVVSGVNLIVDPGRLTQLGKLGILSPSGRCVPFGAGADGTVLGEGVVSVVIRPLKEAERRGDRIYALIKGTGVSVGAGSVGFTAPNPTAQSQATRRAIAASGVDPRTINYIETHGTGTELGDPIEVRGLELAYCDRSGWQPGLQVQHRCTIGSVKPNVGHLEAGAGLMGVVKAALQLHHRVLVPSLTSEEPNSQIPFDQLPFEIQRTRAGWQRSTAIQDGRQIELPRRAGVNSFGVGGSNVHVILEEYDDRRELNETSAASVDRSTHLLTLSAASESALRLQASAWADFLQTLDSGGVGDACFSANVGRRRHPFRAAVVVGSGQDAEATLKEIARGDVSPEQEPLDSSEESWRMRTALLFSGQGAQYPWMLHTLYQESPIYREVFDSCSCFLDELLPRNLQEVIFSGEIGDRSHEIHQTGFTQPALFVSQMALFELWKSWGVLGDVLMGHSIGEVAAYCAAGGCSREDGLRLVAARGQLMQRLPPGGAMCSVALDHKSVAEAIRNDSAPVAVAAINGPNQTVISGPSDAVDQLARQFEGQQISTTRLAVSHAFHSDLMEPMLEEFGEVLRGLDLRIPKTPIVSSATGESIGQQMATPEYWLRQVANPVRFLDAMASLNEQGVTHYLELGPHPVLLGMGRPCLPQAEARWLASSRRGRNDWSTALDSLGDLYVDGAAVDWKSFDAPYPRRRIDVPGYRFNKRRVWIEQLDAGFTPAASANRSAVAAKANSIDQLAYRVDWKKSCRKMEDRDAASGRWLVVSPDRSTAEPFLNSLRERGLEAAGALVQLSSGAGKTGTDSDEPTSDELISDEANWTTCRTRDELENLLRLSSPLAKIVWVDSSVQHAGSAAEDPRRAASDNVFGLSQLVASTSRVELSSSRSLWVVTGGSIAVEPETSVWPAGAAVWGLSRVIALEHVGSWGGIVDVDRWDAEADVLIDEMLSPSIEDQVAFRDGQRYVPRLDRLDLSGGAAGADELAGPGWNDGVVLVTGGLGGVGIRVTRWLAQQGASQFILTSRSGKVSEQAEAILSELRDSEIDVAIVAADVSTQEGIRRCFAALEGRPLSGVVHAAGVDSHVAVADATAEDVESVLAAKTRGAWLLHEVCQNQDVRLFLCLSSISSVWGSAGRGLYAAANAFLDAVAHQRRSMGLPALSVNFGPWQGGGMADDRSLAELERIGIRGLEADAAFEQLGRLLRAGHTQAILADIDWSRFRPVMEARAPKPLFGSLGKAEPSSPQPAGDGAGGQPAWVKTLRRTPAEERPRKVIALVRDEVARMLRVPDPASIAIERNLYEIGMDSLTSAELANSLRRQTGLADAASLLGRPSVARIAEALLPRLAESVRNGPAASPPKAFLKAPLVSQDDTAATPRSSAGDGHRSAMARLSNEDAGEIIDSELASESAIFDFCSEAWPHRRRDRIGPRWKWMFHSSAARLNVKPKVWLYQSDGRIVGHHGAQFIRFKLGEQERTTAWLVDTMVLESYRVYGVGTRLVMQSQIDMPFNLSLGQSEQMRTILERLGWQRVAPLETYVLLLNPARVLRHKLPAAVTPMASAWFQLRKTARRMRQGYHAPATSIREIDQFDSRHDELWKRVATGYGCATVRNASYLNWKYVDQPGQSFIRLDVLDDDQLVGSIVLSRSEPDRAYQYRRVHIVEMVAACDLPSIAAVLQPTIDYCKSIGTDAVVMHLINPTIQQALENHGFLRRSPTRHLVVSVDETVDQRKLLDPSQWLVTQGDSDIDRPW